MVELTQRPRRKRLSWESRCEIVAMIERGVSPPLAAIRGGASRATGYRLWRRYEQGGWGALRDRPSIPRRQPRRLSLEQEQLILAARRRSSFGPVRLAGLVAFPPSTIGKVLRRNGCSRLPRVPGTARCVRRYERDRPGELLHVDTKKLGRFWEPGKRVLGASAARPHKNRRLGWQHLHVAIDDHSKSHLGAPTPSSIGTTRGRPKRVSAGELVCHPVEQLLRYRRLALHHRHEVPRAHAPADHARI
jgi:hypothetical protein